jgi:hypothetical protein
MIVREACLPFDRLTALALAAHAPQSDHDRLLLAHISACARCAAKLSALTGQIDSLREVAFEEADAAFDDAVLEAQRSKILDRLSHLGKAARVLRFPARSREAAMPVSPISRRWISVAAAAGLIIGVVAGQLIHLMPWETSLHRSPLAQGTVSAPRGSGPIIIQASTTVATSTDEDLLDEIDDAMELRRAISLRALDAFTPRVGETIEIR